jgi:hypothetical protein
MSLMADGENGAHATRTSARQPDPVWLYPSTEEARDLFAALEYYFENGGSPDPEWHVHVGPGEGLTIAVEA